MRRVLYLSHATPDVYAIIGAAVPPGFQLLTLERDSDDERRQKIRDSEIVIVAATPFRKPVIDAAHKLELVHHQGVGWQDTTDHALLRERSIPLAFTPEGTTVGVAEHTVLLMLAILKRLPFADRELREGRFHINALRPVSREISGMTIGYVGMGRIARAVAERLAPFGTRGVFFDPNVEAERGLAKVSLDELLQASDIVTLHLPLTRETRHLMNRERLGRMKRGAYLVNTARGGLVDEQALLEVLQSGAARRRSPGRVRGRAGGCRASARAAAQRGADAAYCRRHARCARHQDEGHLRQRAALLPRRAARQSRVLMKLPANDVVAALQEDIVLGRLAPGARLVEEELAERLRTKRHVLREAFVELERFGLIERRRNRGASVRQLTLEDVNQIYAVREILERAAAAQVPFPLEKKAYQAIEGAQRRHDAAVEAGDAKAVFRANFEFHEALFAACGNPYLAAAIDDFRRKTHVVWSYAIVKPEYFRNAQREHRAMLKALREGGRKRLIELCAAHLDISRQAYLQTHRLRFSAR